MQERPFLNVWPDLVKLFSTFNVKIVFFEQQLPVEAALSRCINASCH